MNFATPAFLFFLAVVAAAALAVSSPKLRKVVLLVASYIFYATWNVPFIALILLSTSVDYFLSKGIATAKKTADRKTLLVLGIAVNLLVLGIFKYCNFFVDSANQAICVLFQHAHALQHLAVLLPLGISFYTFEAISYLIDVYRGADPADSFYEYNFYIMYFPHLISGPIVRYRELSCQIKDGISLPSTTTILKGVELIVLGLLFKGLIADSVSGLADPVFADVSKATVSGTYLAWAAFTVQIYFDFMGYTHIARGVSLLFNISLPLNFDHPYNASNISNFWQRWHISLSRWIRDYLFIPIGGSRYGEVRTAANLLITMAIAGAWHGAGWPFIIWGVYHGLLLLGYHTTAPIRNRIGLIKESGAYRTISAATTFILVAFGWVWFRSPDMKVAFAFCDKLARVRSLFTEVSTNFAHGDYFFVVTMVMLITLCVSGPLVVRTCTRLSLDVPHWIKVQVATTALVLCYIFSGAESKPFIYFQF